MASDDRADSTVGAEVELISRYLEIERVRFEEDLVVDLDVSAESRQCAVPPLLIHTLVENAIKHGWRTSKHKPLRVGVSADYDGSTLRVEVTNSGEVRDSAAAPRDEMASDGAGVGLVNVEARLEAAYPGNHSFTLVGDSGVVAATVEISSPRVA